MYGSWVAVCVATCLAASDAAGGKQYNITVGYLPSLTGELRDRQGLTISGALTIALEEINHSTEILPDVQILMKWNDTKSDTVTATRLLTDMSCSGVVAFFGLEGRCHTEAIIAQSRNLPMIAYKCSDCHTTTSNFILLDPMRAASKSVISLLRYYRWSKFSILYEESSEAVALALEDHAKSVDMMVIHQKLVDDQHKCCERKLPCCTPHHLYQIIKDTKKTTRIYVFLGSTYTLSDFLSAMEMHNLFASGEYMVIFVDPMGHSTYLRAGRYFKSPEDLAVSDRECSINAIPKEFEKKAQSLLVVTPPGPSSSYSEFTDRVLHYNYAEPFRFPNALKLGIKPHVSIYAGYLYDSVKIYASALDDLIKEDTHKEPLTYSKLMNIAQNGSRVVAKMIEKSPYQSVTGMSIRLDERGDSEGNFLVLAFKPARPGDDFGINCTYEMVPIGSFQDNGRHFPVYKLNARHSIEWAGGVKPEDEPYGGFKSSAHSHVASKIIILPTIAIVICHWMKINSDYL